MSGTRVTAQVQFAIVPEWLLYATVEDGDRRRPISAQAIRVYAVLARIADQRSKLARATHATIGKRAGQVSPATVKRAIGELDAVGALDVAERIDGQGQHANEYVVRVTARQAQPSLLETDEASDLGSSPVTHPQLTSERGFTSEPGAQVTGELQNESPSVREPLQTSPSAKSPTEKPTTDSVYLAARINETWNATKGALSPAALQRFVRRFGAALVEDAVRELHGFPPGEAVRSPYAYLEAILNDRGGVRALAG